jgi:hypothetical protein
MSSYTGTLENSVPVNFLRQLALFRLNLLVLRPDKPINDL